jgi:hypothetical protein
MSIHVVREDSPDGATTWTVAPKAARSEILISSVRLWSSPGHDHIRVWNRGGGSGDLTVRLHDGLRIVARILGVSLSMVRGDNAR